MHCRVASATGPFARSLSLAGPGRRSIVSIISYSCLVSGWIALLVAKRDERQGVRSVVMPVIAKGIHLCKHNIKIYLMVDLKDSCFGSRRAIRAKASPSVGAESPTISEVMSVDAGKPC